MKLIFAGTPDFAVPSLRQCLLNHDVVAVYTQPDRPAGRGRQLQPSPVKKTAIEHGISVQQPVTLRGPCVQTTLKQYQADLMVVVAYGLLLPAEVLATPKYGCVNVHASLLPRWRGAAPVQHAILANDNETGVCIMQMDIGLDTGPVLEQTTCSIASTDTAQTLHDRLADLGAKTLAMTLANFSQRIPKPQLTSGITYANKITKQNAKIDWGQTAESIACQIRAYNPWPISFTTAGKLTLRIWQAELLGTTNSAAPGTVISVSDKGIDVVTGSGMLRLTKIQLPAGTVQSIAALLNGRKLTLQVGARLGST